MKTALAMISIMLQKLLNYLHDFFHRYNIIQLPKNVLLRIRGLCIGGDVHQRSVSFIGAIVVANDVC